MRNVILTLETVTYSIKSKKLLSNSGIVSKVVKIHPNQNNKSCTYGIEIKHNDFYGAVAILRNNGINYTVYSGI